MDAASPSVRRTGPAIRAVLAELAPLECQAFETELTAAIREAAHSLDLTRAELVLDRWWGIATLRLHPPTHEEQRAVAQAHAGDFSNFTADPRQSQHDAA